jgi:hypothetical protein
MYLFPANGFVWILILLLKVLLAKMNMLWKAVNALSDMMLAPIYVLKDIS